MQEDFDGLSERDASQAETACSRDRTGWQAYEEEEFADSELGSESGDVLQDMQSARNGDVLRFKRPFDGFDPAIMKLGTRRPQPLVLPRGESWKCIENLSDGDLVPVRAEVFNIPASFLTVDSKTFGSWHTQKKISHRMTASAALLSLLFQGRAAGIPSGEHEEWARSSKEEEEEAQEADGSESPAPSRGRKRKKKGESSSLKHVSKYTYISPLDEDDSWPMYQIGCEEVKSVDGCKLLAWRIWIFTYHDKHSSSHLMSKVIQDTDKLYTSQRMCADSLHTRNRSAVTEMETRKKHKGGFEDMHGKIDNNAGMQFYRIRNLEILKNMLRVYSGSSPENEGRPVVADIDEHVNCAAGRRELAGDANGYGGMHPLSPEFVFNAKRKQSLSAGLVDDNGRPMDVCESQLCPSSYFAQDGSFKLAVSNSGAPHIFYVSSSLNKRTIFDCSLPRSSGGSVQPGDHLMSLFLETHFGLQKANAFTVAEYSRFRELARLDAAANEEEWHLKSQLHAYDLMGNIGSSNVDVTSSGEEKYVISVKSACEVAQEDTVRIYERLVKPWEEQQTFELRQEEDRFLSLHPDAEDSHPALQAIQERKRQFHGRFYDVKEDWAKYHLRCLEHCFVSSSDRETNPGGFNSMYDSLTKLVSENNGYSCYTDPGRSNVKRRYTAKDKSPWAHLQEFLAHIFQDDCRMDGRDERIAHEVYLSSFEMFTPLTFILVLSSEPGRGKSVFSSRFASVMPPGMCTESSSTSKKANMNGNICSQDGRVCFADELPDYLTPADPSEQIERIKQVCGESRSYTSERTMEVAGANGSKSHKTVTIKSPDRRVNVILTNVGPALTPSMSSGKEEPKAGKVALLTRTVAFNVRSFAASRNTSQEDFKAHMLQPRVQKRVDEFRLLTSLAMFCRLAILRVPSLQPDLGYARVMFRQFDDMLAVEFNMPRPDSRRQDKRAQNLVTMCLLEAVARTYMFGQSAEFCAPKTDDGHIKPFEIGDLWHVIRTAHPTMEMILAAWSQSLEYSVPTSCNGVNVMTSICEKFGFDLESLMRAPIADDSVESECDIEYGDLQELPHLMSREGNGSSKELLRAMELKLGDSRKQRSIFRNSVGDNKQSKSMLAALEESCDNADKRFSSALFPPFEHVASLFYSPHSLLQWAVDEPSHSPPISSHGEYQHRSLLKFRHLESGEGPTQLDTAWLCVVERKQHESIPWISAARELMGLPCAAKLADIPTESVGDIMFLLSTSQNNRICPRMPELPSSMRPENAFVDENGQPATANSMSIAVRPVMENGRTIPAAGGNPGVRIGEDGATSTRDLAQRRIDALVCRGRLPAVSALVSANMTRMPPLARFTEPKQSLSANSTVLYEHICMVLECILCCNRVPGLKNRQERLSHDQSAPPGLGNNTGARGACSEARILPYSIDVVQMGWTVCAFEKLYNPLLTSQIETANSALITQLGSDSQLLTPEDTFECTFRYLGFPNPECPLAGLKFVSLPWRTAAAGEHVDISNTNPLASITREQLRSQVATALGHLPTDDDIDEYQKGMLGGSFAYGVSGDVNSVATWIEHTGESFIARGNTDGRLDRSGKLSDRALSVGVLGAASGIYARVQERLQKVDVYPAGSSYTYEERHRSRMNSRGADEAAVQKPRRRISCLPGLAQRNDWAHVEQSPASGERFDTRQTAP